MSDPTKRADETIDGGKYVDERGFWINANGEYIDEGGKVVERPIKANQPKPNSTPAPTKPAEK